MGLGATPIRTIFKVNPFRQQGCGILSGVILGVGRAIGETMAVIMVAGNVANMPTLLGTTRFLTTGIANGNVLCVRSASSGIICNRFGAIYLYYDCKYLPSQLFQGKERK